MKTLFIFPILISLMPSMAQATEHECEKKAIWAAKRYASIFIPFKAINESKSKVEYIGEAQSDPGCNHYRITFYAKDPNLLDGISVFVGAGYEGYDDNRKLIKNCVINEITMDEDQGEQ